MIAPYRPPGKKKDVPEFEFEFTIDLKRFFMDVFQRLDALERERKRERKDFGRLCLTALFAVVSVVGMIVTVILTGP